MRLLARVMRQLRVWPEHVGIPADGDSWCVSFGCAKTFYADIEFFDHGIVVASHIGATGPPMAYHVKQNCAAYCRWIRFALAYTGQR